MPALGSAFLPKRVRSRSRSAALSRSKVPSVRHLPNDQYTVSQGGKSLGSSLQEQSLFRT